VIRNTPPTAPKVVLGPDAAKTRDPLSVTVATESSDVDGDRVVYRYNWIKDGSPETRFKGRNRIDASATKKGQVWRVVVTPFDGEVEGESSNALLTIRNTVPNAPQVGFNLSAPKVDQKVEVLVKKPAVDADGDPISYRYRYAVGDEALAIPVSSAVVPPRTLRKHQKLQVEVTAWDDEAPGGSATVALEVANTPPEPPQHAIAPAAPKTSDPLTVGVRVQPADADRDPVTLDYQWFLNGKPVQQPIIVPPAATKKGQTWTVRVTPRDNEAKGRPVEAKVLIQNTPPVAPVAVLPSYAFDTSSGVEPQIRREAFDADGDRVTLRYDWRRDGRSSGVTSAVLPASSTAKNQRWQVVITPNDGAVDGAPTSLSFSIENSAPSAPKVSFSSSTPSVRDNVSVKLDAPARDVDGDRLAYRYRWFRDGVAIDGWPTNKNTLKAFDAKKGEQIRVEVVAFDGTVEGRPAIAELLVRNHEPDPPTVGIVRSKAKPRKVAARGSAPKPAALTTMDDLECAITKAAVDPDKDPVTYRYRWYRAGVLVPTASDLKVLPASMTTEGERWECEAEGFDGLRASRPSRAPAVTLVNSPPDGAQVSVFPKKANTGDDLICEITKFASDPDYDAIRYSYRWRLNGREQPIQGNRVEAAKTSRGQRWQCEVVANDGQQSGPAAAGETTIGNTPPTAPVVNLATPAFAGEDLNCVIQQPSVDADRDRVGYRYRWIKDGVAQSFAGESQQVPGRLVKKGDLWKCEVVASDSSGSIAPAGSPAVAVQAARKKISKSESRGQKRKRRGRRRR
ncbi:MAG: hypothetical protein AAF658_08075, partial [Myxococcota bacterium]